MFSKSRQEESKKNNSSSKKNNFILPFDQSDIVPQYGFTCKLTAIASIDHFFARSNGFKPIPVFKNSHGFYAHNKCNISLRQLAKTMGSMQGELLEVNQVKQLLNDKLGYKSRILTINNEEIFRNKVIKELKKGQPCISFFCANTEQNDQYGYPIISDDEDREHGCLITGYHSSNDTLRITHWGQHFYVSFKDFYQSNQNLKKTRHPEQYFSFKELLQAIQDQDTTTQGTCIQTHKQPFNDDIRSYFQQNKYYSVDEERVKDISKWLANSNYRNFSEDMLIKIIKSLAYKETMIPRKNSGFRGKLICIAPLTLEMCQEMAFSELRNPARSTCSII